MSAAIPVEKLCAVADLNPQLDAGLLDGDIVSFLPMSAVDAECVDAVDMETREVSEVKKGYTPFRSDDVLVAKITPCFENGKIAQAKLTRSHGFGSTEFHVVRPKVGKLHPRFLVHYLRQKRILVEGERKMTGSAGQRRVPEHFLAGLSVPVPPLPEQRRIAEILDKADALRAKRRAAIAQLDTFTQSIFLDVFGDPATNPKGWPESKLLGDVADITSGVTIGRKLSGKQTRIVPYLAVVNVQDGYLDLTTAKTTPATKDEIQKYRLIKDDLLLTEGGDPDKLGRGSLWADQLPECIHQNHVFRVRLRSDALTPLFLSWLIGSQRGKRYFLRSAKQTTGIASINMTQLRAFPLIIPSLKNQRECAERVEACRRLKLVHVADLAALDDLFNSLQHRAFSGELATSARGVASEKHRATNVFERTDLNVVKGIEALIYVASHTPRHDLYKTLKTIYVADRYHLEHFGRLIYGETHCALPMGPVPQAAYDAAKVLNGELLVSPFPCASLRDSLRRTAKQLIPLRSADLKKLSIDEVTSLDWALQLCAPMSFEGLKRETHDAAFDVTPANHPIRIEDMGLAFEANRRRRV